MSYVLSPVVAFYFRDRFIIGIEKMWTDKAEMKVHLNCVFPIFWVADVSL